MRLLRPPTQRNKRFFSISELTDEDIKELPDAEFLKIVTKLSKNSKKYKEFKEYAT